MKLLYGKDKQTLDAYLTSIGFTADWTYNFAHMLEEEVIKAYRRKLRKK